MKTTQATMFLFASLMLVTIAGCGKDNKSSGGVPVAPIAPIGGDPLIGNTVDTNGTQAYNNAQAWYASRTEPSTFVGVKQEYRIVQRPNNQNDCKNKSYLGGFINIQTCFSGSQKTTPAVKRTVYVVASPVKSSNPKLSPVFSSSLTLINASQSGALYTLEFGKTNGHVIRYKIDTSLNSAFNPVEIWDTEQGRLEYVANPNDLR